MVVHVVLMAHGRMAGTCVTDFLIMQAGLSFGTKEQLTSQIGDEQ